MCLFLKNHTDSPCLHVRSPAKFRTKHPAIRDFGPQNQPIPHRCFDTSFNFPGTASWAISTCSPNIQDNEAYKIHQ